MDSFGVPKSIGQLAGSAYHNTTQTLVDSTFTTMNFNSEDFQVGACHTTSDDNTKVKAKLPGTYLFVVQATFDASILGYRILAPKRNGAFLSVSKTPPVASGGGTTAFQATFIIFLAAGDYVQCDAWQSSGGNLNIGDTASRFAQNSIAWALLQ